MGILAGIIPFFAVAYLKRIFGYDDALDTFGIHGVGGTLGAILTGIFADPATNSVVTDLKEGLVVENLKAVVLTIVWSVAATAIIAYIVKFTIGLRPDAETEETGLDLVEHGESGYEH
jgi:Amt family ammonium transporter